MEFLKKRLEKEISEESFKKIFRGIPERTYQLIHGGIYGAIHATFS